jgi:hypothetical protein
MERRKAILAGAGFIGAIAYGKQNKVGSSQFFGQSPNVLLPANAADTVDIVQYLRLQPQPKFKRGHTLPPLSRFGWIMPTAAGIELAERWGYALEWDGSSRISSLVASDPKKYRLSVILHREPLPNMPESMWLHNALGELVNGQQIWSPEAPEAALRAIARLRTEHLQKIQAKAPISVILNGGEFGLPIPAVAPSFAQDPRVVAAKGSRTWFDYISERKAYQEAMSTQIVREVVPNRSVYAYYGGDSNPHRARYPTWYNYAFDYKYMQTTTDYPSSSAYFKAVNTGWTGKIDILTGVLNSVGQQIKAGDPLSYNWVCSGWVRGPKNQPVFGEIYRYMGFLKCYYTAGMIGGIAGYFDLPKNGFDAPFDFNRPPDWLRQMIVLADVHALFSYFEDYLRSGDLLAGPITHRWSRDTPAYEFPTEDPEVRVLARKHKQKASWLITAWAASGDSRQVSVDIPTLGRISLLARPEGSVYTASVVSGKAQLNWRDSRTPIV